MVEQYHHADEILRSGSGHPLFIGDLQSAEDLDWLREHNIRTVITVAANCPMHYDSSIRHIVYDLQDKKNANASMYFDMAGLQIDKSLRTSGVLVHCGAGVSRSTTVVIAYLIKYKAMTFLQALRFVKSKRPGVCPNLGFELQLKSYQKSYNQANHTFMLSSKKRQHRQFLPDLSKPSQKLHITSYHQPFPRENYPRHSNLSLSKSLRPVQSQEKKQVQYLRKMAEFRFGITNMSRWRIGGLHSQGKKDGF